MVIEVGELLLKMLDGNIQIKVKTIMDNYCFNFNGWIIQIFDGIYV